MKPALTVFLRADKTTLERELARVLDAETRQEADEEFEHGFLILIGATEGLKKRGSEILRSERWSVFNPLPESVSPRQVAEYVRHTFIDKIARSYPSVHFLWDGHSSETMLALATVEACSRTIRWWAPNRRRAELGRLPETPSSFGLRDLFSAVADSQAMDEILGESREVRALREMLRAAAPLPVPVVLVGETGTGKELAARALHELSGRSGRLIAVNGALLNPDRAESDLFGHKKGAFTGADRDREGRIREASGGTFFLDELGALPRHVQAQLLRATAHVERGAVTVTPMGAEDADAVNVDTRFVGALQCEPTPDDFRQDLYHRLSWIRVELPPLRTRVSDAPLIARAQLAKLHDRYGSGPKELSDDLRESLADRGFHSWPGNVRELGRVVFAGWFGALREKSELVGVEHVRPHLRGSVAPADSGDLKRDLARHALAVGERALARHPGNKSAAARSLGFDSGQALERFLASQRRELDGA